MINVSLTQRGSTSDVNIALAAAAMQVAAVQSATTASYGAPSSAGSSLYATTLTGNGFTYDPAGHLTGGTITGIQQEPASGYGSLNGGYDVLSSLSIPVPLAVTLGTLGNGDQTLLNNGISLVLGGSGYGYGGDDTFSFGPALYSIYTDPNEIYGVPPFAFSVDGGGGANTLQRSGFRAADAITGGGGTETITGGIGFDGGQLNLTRIQQIGYADGMVFEYPLSAASQAYMVARAVLATSPDPITLGQYVQQVQGSSVAALADTLLTSPAGQAANAGLSNAQFVTRLYATLYGRLPDGGGQAVWTNALDTGAYTRAQVVSSFTGSVEAKAVYGGTYGSGQVFAADPNAVEVLRGYETLYGHLPDAAGLSSFTHALETPGYETDMTFYNGLVATVGLKDNVAFVNLLQTNTSGSVDPNVSTAYAAQIASGALTQTAVAQMFADSAAGTAKIMPFVTSQGVAHL